MWNWLRECPRIRDLYFSFGEAKRGATVLAPVTAFADEFDREFIDGGGLKHCDFALIRFETIDPPPDGGAENVEILLDVGALAEWIADQNDAGAFPDFPEDCLITGVHVLPSGAGGIAAHDEYSAQYMLQFRVEYIYQKEDA